MRRLAWFTLGFAAGLAVAVWILGLSWLLPVAFALLPLSILLNYLKSPGIRRRIIACVLLGFSVALIWFRGYDYLILRTPRAYDTQEVELRIEVSDYTVGDKNGTSGEGRTTLDGKPYKIQFYLDEWMSLQPGDLVIGQFSLRYTGGQVGTGDRSKLGDGIMLVAYPVTEPHVYRYSQIPMKHMITVLRHKILDKLDQAFPEDTEGFARALLLGNSEKLSLEDDTALQISGIRHIIAVSGLHVTIVFSVFLFLLRRQRFLIALVGIPFLLVFAAMAGFTYSVLRACIIQGVIVLALLFRKEYDSPSSLAFAVLMILGVNPLAITSVGFQLSVGCCVGILMFAGKINRYLFTHTHEKYIKGKSLRARIVRWCYSTVSVSLGALVFTVPLSGYYFGVISTLGVVTNLLTIWIVTPVFYGVAVCSALGFIWMPAAAVLAGVVSWGIRYILTIADWISRVPYAAISAHNLYIMLWVVFAYAMLAVFLLSRKKRPVLLLCCVGCTLAASLWLSAAEVKKDSYRMTVLDVGQGQCILLQSKDKCYVVDCGGEYAGSTASLAAHTLKTQGVFHVDGLILTHYDYDHAGAVARFVTMMDTERIYMPDAQDDSGLRKLLEENYTQQVRYINKETTFDCGYGQIQVFPADRGASGNESSLCILFQTENCDILITGDRSTKGELALVESGKLPQLEFLVAGHHGAESSTSMYLLNATNPQYAIISVGENNRYGHPADETLRRLELFGCEVLRTDLQGTIIIKG